MTTNPAYLNRGGALGIGFESTPGTAVSRTNWVKLLSLTGGTQVQREERRFLNGPDDNTGGMAFDFLEGDRTHDFTARLEFDYANSCVALVAAALGHTADAGAGPYTHTLQPNNELSIPLTIEHIKASKTDGTDRAVVYAGCYIRRLRIDWTTGRRPILEIDFTAMSAAAESTGGTPSFGANTSPVMYYHAGDVSWNSLTLDNGSFRELSLLVENELDLRRGLGSRDPQQPALIGRKVMIESTVEIQQTDTHADYLAGDQSNWTLTFTGSGNDVLALTAYNAKITAHPADSAEGGGVHRGALNWQAVASSSDRGLLVVFTNDNALYTANG